MSTTATQSAQTSSIPFKTTSHHSGPITAKLNFFVPPADGSRPYNYVEKQPEGTPQNNFEVATHDVTISDVRGREQQFSLDKNAFLPISGNEASRASKADFSSDDAVKKTYYPEVEKILLDNLPGSNRVLIFDHTIRRAQPGANREPVMRVHIDQTLASAAQRVRLHLPEEADTLLQGRYRLVNVWRPLNGTVETSPLAVADSTTVSDDALTGIEHRYPDRTGETAGVEYREGTKWYYWSGMGNEERLLLQCFDSESRSRVPHTAFKDERAGKDAKPRESIEVRALIFG